MISRIADIFLDLLFPLTCAVCNREGRFLCEGCEPALTRLEPPFCRICADPGSSPLCSWCATNKPAVDVIRAPYLMIGPAKEMVYNLKYRNVRAAAPDLGRLLSGYLASNPLDADLLTSVPLHPSRKRQRGYNQSELLAREVSRRCALANEPGLLRRVKDSRPQVSATSMSERRANVDGAFECTARIDGRSVLLIDDVATTGATLSACARALRAAGARSVAALVFARQA